MKNAFSQFPLLRSQLYIPGTNPSMLQNAAWMGADGVILDLEDAVSLAEKDSARDLVAETLKSVKFGSVIKIVRINATDTEFWQKDLQAIIAGRPDAIRLPKAESVEAVREVDRFMTQIEKENGLPVGAVKIHAMLETANAVLDAREIARSCPRVSAISLGGQDLAADMGVLRTPTGEELMTARGLVVLAARAARVMAFDTPFTNLNDNEGLAREAAFDMQIGFSGKAAIHPLQCKIINQAYCPTEKALKKAITIARAWKEAQAAGSGVCKVNGAMVDAPVVEQSLSVLQRARAAGIAFEE